MSGKDPIDIDDEGAPSPFLDDLPHGGPPKPPPRRFEPTPERPYTAPLPPPKRRNRWLLPVLLIAVIAVVAWRFGPRFLAERGIDLPEVPDLPDIGEMAAAVTAPPDAAVEVATIHERRETPDHGGGSFSALAKPLTRELDFAPREPGRLQAAGLMATGSKATTWGGQPAALILLSDQRGRLWSLVQAEDTGAIELDTGTWTIRETVNVQVWREGGLVMALASPVIPPPQPEER